MNEKKLHLLHELIIDLSFCSIAIPDKLIESIQSIQKYKEPDQENKRIMLIQQSIGYTVALKDFDILPDAICDNIIDRLHDIR